MTLTLAEARAISHWSPGGTRLKAVQSSSWCPGGERALEPFLDGESWCDDQEAPGEPVVVGCRVPVVCCMVDNKHGHHRRLAGGCSHLVGDPMNPVIVLQVDFPDPLLEFLGSCLVKVDVGKGRIHLGEVGLARLRVGPVVN